MQPNKEKIPDKKDKGNYGPGSFSDQYNNDSMRSMDRDSNPAGVTYTDFEDDMDLLDADFFPDHGEAYLSDDIVYREEFDEDDPNARDNLKG